MAVTSPVPAEDLARIEIAVSGIRTIAGELGVAVFATEDSFDQRLNPVAQTFVSIEASVVSWSTTLEAPGVYAVIVYQDLDGDREIDLSRLGRPQEPYGFSNNARAAFGPPGFEDASVSVAPGDYTFEIELR